MDDTNKSVKCFLTKLLNLRYQLLEQLELFGFNFAGIKRFPQQMLWSDCIVCLLLPINQLYFEKYNILPNTNCKICDRC